MTSVRVKFRKSTIKNKEGVLYFQLIHNRKAKLITTRFRIFPYEWDSYSSSIIITNGDEERLAYLQNAKKNLSSETQQIYNLISLMEKRSYYTVKELADFYVNQSFNGYFFSFIKYLTKKLKSENRTKTASIYETAKRSFSRFRNNEDIRIDKIDSALMCQYEIYLK